MSQTLAPPSTESHEPPVESVISSEEIVQSTLPAPTKGNRRLLTKARLFIALLLATAGAGLAVPGLRNLVFGEASDLPRYVLADVKRGRFFDSVTERGTVSSMKESLLSSNVEGLTRIIFIVPEGTSVHSPTKATVAGTVAKIRESNGASEILIQPDSLGVNSEFLLLSYKPHPVPHVARFGEHTRMLVRVGDRVSPGTLLAGDVVCELDSAQLVEREKQQLISVTQAKANVEKAKKNVEIQQNQNVSDQSKARLDRELAILDLKKFVKGDRSQQSNEQRGAVLIAQEELTQAEESHEYFKRLARKGYKNQVELESARVAVVKARNKLAVASEKLTVLTDFTFERTFKELTEKAAERAREFERVRLQGQAAIAQFQAELSSQRLKYSVENQKLIKLEQQIANCRLVAPQDGKVVYAKQKNRSGEPVVIEEGTTVYQRQRIISLPDFSRMKVEVRIHEAKIKSVHEGMEARIRVEAFPNRVFHGIVESVPDVPVRGAWPNHDLMLFQIEVRIADKNDGDLKPGMNAEVEIVADERDDVLQAPVQAILPVGDRYIAWVVPAGGRKAVLRENIKVGANNNETIEIEEGLSKGDRVVMNAKVQFRDKFAELKSEAERDRAANAKSRGTSMSGSGKPKRDRGDK